MQRTAHHVFIACPEYERFRREAKAKVIRSTDKLLKKDQIDTESVGAQLVAFMATSLFTDDGVWPGGESRYYVGMIPNFVRCLPEEASTKLKYGLSREWHNASVFLASRIWGQRQSGVNGKRQ